jgi:hypothetical protein
MKAAAGGDVKLGGLQTFLCGGVAGCLSRTFTAPLDVTKILFQVQTDKMGESKTGYNSFFGAMTQIAKEEGVKGLWKGNVVACLRLGPYSAVKYYTFETLAPTIKDKDGKIKPISRMIAGATAGVLAVVTTYPLDLVKTRLTVQKSGVGVDGTVYKKTYNGTVDCIRKVIQQEGAASLYKGLSPTIVGVIPFEAIQFTFYNSIRELRQEQKAAAAKAAGKPAAEGDLVTFDFLALGCVSGAVAQTGAYPFDLMRKRFMAQSKAEGMLKTEYSGIMDCAKQIVQQEGILGLYKGTVPNLLKVCPYAAIMWAGYEQARRFFGWCNANGHNPMMDADLKKHYSK